MAIYRFKTVPSEEKDKLVYFINEHWKRNHALVKSEELLRFQHYNQSDDCFNFIVAENTTTNEYDALVGFIPTSQYDNGLIENGDYWGAIWKLRDDVKNEEINTAAFYIWRKLFKLPHFHSYAAIGISDIAKQIYIAMRMDVSSLSHYYMLNNQISVFRVAANVSREYMPEISDKKDYSVKWLDSLENINIQPVYRPFKSVNYFKKRYQQHPIYKYGFVGIFVGNKLETILVVRKIDVNGGNVIRIVDVLGELGQDISGCLQEFIQNENAEYIDFMNYGLPEHIFSKMGFKKLNMNENLIIPNYFEPFEQHNVKIDIAIKADYDNYVAFKGDSDQDRPNVL